MNFIKLLREGIILNSKFSFSVFTVSFFSSVFLLSAYFLFCETRLSSLSESFEDVSFPPAGWTKVNVAPGSTGWERHTAGEHPVPGFSYGTITTPAGGGNAVAFCNFFTGGTYSNDEWLITPLLTDTQPDDSLSFWLRKFGAFTDHMDIKISTTIPNPAAMTISIAELSFNPSDTGWVNYKYRIGSLVPQGSNIFIGFRQWVSSTTNQGASFSLDMVRKTGPIGIKEIDFYIPKSIMLYQNYPNPFNPSTTITYSLAKDVQVKLIIYNENGGEITTLVNDIQSKGIHNIKWYAESYPTGIYFCRLISGQVSEVKKMLLLK